MEQTDDEPRRDQMFRIKPSLRVAIDTARARTQEPLSDWLERAIRALLRKEKS
jgi:hypothetical protein